VCVCVCVLSVCVCVASRASLEFNNIFGAKYIINQDYVNK